MMPSASSSADAAVLRRTHLWGSNLIRHRRFMKFRPGRDEDEPGLSVLQAGQEDISAPRPRTIEAHLAPRARLRRLIVSTPFAGNVEGDRAEVALLCVLSIEPGLGDCLQRCMGEKQVGGGSRAPPDHLLTRGQMLAAMTTITR